MPPESAIVIETVGLPRAKREMATVAISCDLASSAESMPTRGVIPPESAMATCDSFDDAKCHRARAADSCASGDPLDTSWIKGGMPFDFAINTCVVVLFVAM